MNFVRRYIVPSTLAGWVAVGLVGLFLVLKAPIPWRASRRRCRRGSGGVSRAMRLGLAVAAPDAADIGPGGGVPSGVVELTRGVKKGLEALRSY